MDLAADVLSLAPVIDKMKLDRGTIIAFIQRLSQWSVTNKRNRAVGLLLIEKLTNIQNEQAAASVRNAVSLTRRFFLAIAVIICMVILRSSLNFTWVYLHPREVQYWDLSLYQNWQTCKCTKWGTSALTVMIIYSICFVSTDHAVHRLNWNDT